MTTALQIADRFDNDGSRFTDANGVPMVDVCASERERRHVYGDAEVNIFADGSAIAIVPGAWDVVAYKDGAWRSVDTNGDVSGYGFAIGADD